MLTPFRRPLAALVLQTLEYAGVLVACVQTGSDRGTESSADSAANGRVGAGAHPIRRACELDKDELVRTWRGVDPARSEDLIIIPDEPNYQGGFERPSHTGPWDYVQEVPLLFYGPGRIDPKSPVEEPVTIADVYATVGPLLGVDLPQRRGRPLEGVVADEDEDPPRLLVVVMWDGVGTNVLNRWPDAWPNLKRLQANGVSYANATVGSSPSVTPSTHANLATGAFPRAHGISGIHYRNESGEVHRVFEGVDPSAMHLTTFADEIDLAYGNLSEVGLLAWQIAVLETEDPIQTSNHLSMLGRGTTIPGGDADHVALVGHDADIIGGESFSSVPYLEDFPTLEDHIDDLDRTDGEADGLWRDHDITKSHDNPAWVQLQTDMVKKMIEEEGFGQDDVPDVFLTNYKASDLAGHHYTMDSPEMAAVVEAQDAALAELTRYLDRTVGDYVLVLSADHGHTPSPERTGAWALNRVELENDIDEYFGVPDGQP